MNFKEKRTSVLSEKRHISIRDRKRDNLEKIETREQQRISSLSSILNVMIKAVQKAGRGMIRDFGEVSQLQVAQKGPGDFVSNTDLKVEEILIESLTEDRPDYAVISEEKGSIPSKNNSPFTWVIDPIDGTTNFIHAISFFAISIALKHYDDIVATVLYNPVLNELYFAEKGQGAFLMNSAGNKRLRVSSRFRLSEAMMCFAGVNNQQGLDIMQKFLGKVVGIRSRGAVTLELASVAAGQTDGFVLRGTNLWDVASGYLLIKEAGGKIMTFDGKTDLQSLVKSDYIIASNLSLSSVIQKELIKKG